MYIDPKNTYFELLVQVVKHNGAAFNADSTQFNTGLGDNFFHSMFEKGTVRLAEQDIEYRSSYAYDAFVQQITQNTKEVKSTVLASTSGWMEDGGVGKNWATLTDLEKAVRKYQTKGSPVMSFFWKTAFFVF